MALGESPNPAIAWTPDGLEIVFSSGYWSRSGLWRLPAKSPAEPRRLALASDNAMAPAISLQGSRLAYMTQRWECNIWLADLGSPGLPVKWISSSGLTSCPDFSSDGARLAFVSDQSGDDEIWTCSRDGSNREKLTSFGGPTILGPRWSPDGRSIALSAQANGNEDIYLVEARGGISRRLTSHAARDSNPSWSPNGESIYFTSDRTGSSEIWQMPSGGGDAVQVTGGGGQRDRPAEAHDGKALYYQKKAGSRCSVWKMPVVAGGESLILESVSCEGGWAVTSEGIYFVSPLDAQGRNDLLLHEFASGKTRKVLTTAREVGRHIALSPDGRAILYPQWDQGGSDLMLLEKFR
jgi:Tol biopolymer transport system component